MSCDLVEIRLNNGLVISFHDNAADGWFRKDRPSERDMWERMASALRGTDFEAVKRLYGHVQPETVRVVAKPGTPKNGGIRVDLLANPPAAEKA